MLSLQDRIRIYFGSVPVGMTHHLSDVIRGSQDIPSEYSAQAAGPRCFVFGVANFPNIGDLAISMAQNELLSRVFHSGVILVETGRLWNNIINLRRIIKPEDVICIHGGGNMGGRYSQMEFERCAVISLFPYNKIVVMPQTIDYSSQENQLLEYTQKVYGRHNDLHLFARERKSFRLMQRYYPTTTVALVPDIVLSLDMTHVFPREPIRKGTLLAMRRDPEKSLTAADMRVLVSALGKQKVDYTFTDTTTEGIFVQPSDREKLILSKLQEFQRAELVITDRLHGMIFAALSGTPCIALNNSDKKVEGVYKWLSDVPYVKFARNIEEAAHYITPTIKNGSGIFPSDKLAPYYAPLLDELQRV